MNTQQLIGWMKAPSLLGKEASAQLDTLTQTFPYFQTAHLLYIKSLHNENSFLYNNQLKVSAAYATNRKVLYELITSKRKGTGDVGTGGEKKEVGKKEIEKLVVEEKITNDQLPIINKKQPETQNPEPETIQPDFPKKRFTKDEDEWESGMIRQLQLLHHWQTTPQEILAKRIEEINAEKSALAKASEDKKEKAPTAADEINTLLYVLVEPGEAEDISTSLDMTSDSLDMTSDSSDMTLASDNNEGNDWNVKVLDEESSAIEEKKSEPLNVPQDAVSQEILRGAISSSIELEVDDAMPSLEELGHLSAVAQDDKRTASIQNDKNLSAVTQNDKKEKPDEELTFTSWLKQLNTEPALDEKAEKQPVKSELVDKFIQDAPRIQVNKATFFSPVNMAKKSVQDNDEFITETLAKIYIKQGNISKGIRAYQKLSLKFPEKSSYFAALIEELKRTPKS